MAGLHSSPRNDAARKKGHPLLTVFGSLRGGTQTVGPGRLVVCSDRFCVTSRIGGAWAMERWTAPAVPSWSGLRYGGDGCSPSAVQSSTRTLGNSAQSVATSLRCDAVGGTVNGGDDPADRAEQTPHRVAPRVVCNPTTQGDGEPVAEEFPHRHSDDSNRLTGGGGSDV